MQSKCVGRLIATNNRVVERDVYVEVLGDGVDVFHQAREIPIGGQIAQELIFGLQAYYKDMERQTRAWLTSL